MTSPPYWGLRDYGNKQIFGGDADCEHEWEQERIRGDKPGKPGPNATVGARFAQDAARRAEPTNHCLKCKAWKGQLGLEPTPELYIEHMTAVFHEVKRVLKKEGTLWLNIGDTYGGDSPVRKSGTEQFDPEKQNVLKKSAGGTRRGVSKEIGIKPKCLTMIPERLAWSLIQDGWILRNKIVWYKPNGMPSSVKDRFTNKWEHVFLFSKSKRYHFDLDAVREPFTEPLNRWGGNKIEIPKETKWKSDDEKAKWAMSVRERTSRPNPLGKNPGDVFEIPTQPFPEAHFAVFPEKLCRKPIKAGCPEEVCKKCGKGKERIIELGKISSTGGVRKNRQSLKRHNYENPKMIAREHKTIGWTSCGCNAGFDGGIVLDPFCGAGTVGVVAKELGRNFIGIDIKKEYCDMAEKRIAKVGYQQELAL